MVSGSTLWSFVESPLLETQSAQGSQAAQNSATSRHALSQFPQVSGDKLESFLAPSRTITLRQCDVCIYIKPGLLNGFDQQFHKLLCAFNVVKWSLWPVAHAVCAPSHEISYENAA